jgi:hypothetical protein
MLRGMSLRIFRVTVRGRFGELDEPTLARLRAEADAHDTLEARFTATGTLVYDLRYKAFSFRIEVRARGEDAETEAIQAAEAAAVAHLDAAGIPWRDLRSEAADMADVWR